MRASGDSLMIVGDGDLRVMLAEFAAQRGLEQHVRFTRALAEVDVIEVHARCDTLVLPSDLEV